MDSTPNYSLYLVTDSSMVPAGTTFLTQVKEAIHNGITMVQLREKHLSTLDFINRANQILELTRPCNVPLIINDRVDVALAVDADGVHVGQDDMPATLVRKLIGPNKILGVSCSHAAEVLQVCEQKVADYVGLGSVYPTLTKDVKNVCGPLGVRSMLRVLSTHGPAIKSVAIGGINEGNAGAVRYFCLTPRKGIDGVAVVSCIMAAKNPETAVAKLADSWNLVPAWCKRDFTDVPRRMDFSKKPLVHHITNNVVKNFSANVTLAVGGSPIMSELPAEYAEFASLPLPGSLVVNLGTPTVELLDTFIAGLRTYNAHNKPVLFDPVAAGALQARLDACRKLLNAGHFSVIKGNVGEIMAVYSLTGAKLQALQTLEPSMQGVDSIADLAELQITAMGSSLATDLQNIVVITGKTNYVIDGTVQPASVTKVSGGHELMGAVTGSGCSLGSVIAAYIAVSSYRKYDLVESVERALRLYNEAGATAAHKSSGPGTFIMHFLDALAALSADH